MSETNVNPSYLERGHPIRQMIEASAQGGGLPTASQLDELAELDAQHLPDGEGVARFSAQISTAARECAGIRATGANLEARRCAERHVARLAALMTDAERSLAVSEAHPEALDDISARMFGRN